MKYIVDIQEVKNCTTCTMSVTNYKGSTCKLDDRTLSNLDFKIKPLDCKLEKIGGNVNDTING